MANAFTTTTSGISPIGDNEGIYGIMSSFTKPFDDLEGVTNRPAAQQWAVCTLVGCNDKKSNQGI